MALNEQRVGAGLPVIKKDLRHAAGYTGNEVGGGAAEGDESAIGADGRRVRGPNGSDGFCIVLVAHKQADTQLIVVQIDLVGVTDGLTIS